MLKYTSDKSQSQKVLDDSEEQFKGISKLKGDNHVLVAENRKKEVFFVSEPLLKIFNIISKKKHPYTIGFYFGELKDKVIPSLESLFRFAKISDYHKVVISRKEEMRFLYGRDIRAGQIRKYDEKIKKGDEVIICNKFNEALGLGKLTGNPDSSKSTETVIKNISDRGWYLRHKE